MHVAESVGGYDRAPPSNGITDRTARSAETEEGMIAYPACPPARPPAFRETFEEERGERDWHLGFHPVSGRSGGGKKKRGAMATYLPKESRNTAGVPEATKAREPLGMRTWRRAWICLVYLDGKAASQEPFVVPTR